MLKILREKKASFVSWIIIGGIIVTFTLFGYFSRDQKGNEYAAIVNNKPIRMEDFKHIYRQIYKKYQNMFKDKFSKETAEMLNIRMVALENLINREVVVQSAQKNGILVTSQDISNAIQNNDNFKSANNEFDKDLYRRILRANRLSQKRFENDVKKDLYVRNMIDILSHGIKVSPYEMEKQFIAENDKVVLEYIKLNPSDMKIKITQKEISEFLKNKSSEIKKFYKDNISKYKKDEKIKARHILIKNSGPESQKRIEDIHKQATPENFASMAQKYSEGPTSKQGGDLGIFDKKTMDPNFSRVAFNTDPGKISKPVKSKFGWHIIYVEEKIPAVETPLEKVKKEIAKKILNQHKLKEKASNKAEEIVKNIKKPKELLKLTNSLKLKWTKTEPFKFGTYIKDIGNAKEVIASAFRLKNKDDFIPRYFFINDSYYFFKLEKRIKPDMTKLEEYIKNKENDLKDNKEKMFVNEWQMEMKKLATIRKNESIISDIN